MHEFSDDKFQAEVLDSKIPVLVDLWAPWCGPCRMLTPVVEELAINNKDKALVGKMNIDDHQDAPTQYGVTAIPTILIFKGGKVVERFVGVTSKAKLQEALDKAMADGP